MSVLLVFFVIGALICVSLPAETNIVFFINLNGIEYWEPRLDWRWHTISFHGNTQLASFLLIRTSYSSVFFYYPYLLQGCNTALSVHCTLLHTIQ